MLERRYFLVVGVVALLLTAESILSSPLDKSKREAVFVEEDEGNPITDSILIENHTDAPEATRSSLTPVPPYVESLYKCWQKEDKTQMRECLKSMDEALDFEEITFSNTVNFLIGQGILDDRNLSNVTDRPQYQSIKFNLSSIQHNDDSTLQYAELRVHKEQVMSDDLLSFNSSICPIENSGVTLSLLTSLMSDGKDHIIERVPVSYESLLSEGWIQFHTNLEPVLSEWLQKSQERVERTFKLVLQGGCASIDLEEIGFSLQEDPLLVTFVRNKSNKMEEEVIEQMAKTTMKGMPRIKREANTKSKKDFGICKLHSYHVNFTSLGWNNFVLEPRSYQANFCAGSCVHPISKHMNGTLHSELIAFSHALDPQKVPNPCCVPTKLLSEMMIVKLDQQSIQLKIYPDMTVTECGCR